MAAASSHPLHVDAVLGLDPVLVRVRGELDLDSAPSLTSLLAPLLTRTIEVDLADVTFIDSSGVNVLLSHQDQCRAVGGCFVVIQPSSVVRRVLQLLGVDGLLLERYGPEGRHNRGDNFPGLP
ncbi:STAS domain-containing protein [Streptomyces sp. NPDC057302]|uniref:STAS domain-containing protein n=1 Tax=Streptomyces sp. NPDC057302 TaxID=3346094 RepID=UPI00363D2C3A